MATIQVHICNSNFEILPGHSAYTETGFFLPPAAREFDGPDDEHSYRFQYCLWIRSATAIGVTTPEDFRQHAASVTPDTLEHFNSDEHITAYYVYSLTGTDPGGEGSRIVIKALLMDIADGSSFYAVSSGTIDAVKLVDYDSIPDLGSVSSFDTTDSAGHVELQSNGFGFPYELEKAFKVSLPSAEIVEIGQQIPFEKGESALYLLIYDAKAFILPKWRKGLEGPYIILPIGDGGHVGVSIHGPIPKGPEAFITIDKAILDKLPKAKRDKANAFIKQYTSKNKEIIKALKTNEVTLNKLLVVLR